MTPDSGAVNVRARSVVFTFDAVISDRADLDKLFLLSPQDGRPRVYWHRNRVEIRPRKGFRPNTSYSLSLLPGLSDLRSNTTKTGRTIIFTTGPTFPPYSVFGRVFDWMNERPTPQALVEVIRHPDSLLYVGIADSLGQFGVGPLDVGTYTVRGIMDNNKNRGLDSGEPWDSVSIVIGGGASPFLELLAAPRDTIPPRLLTVSTPDTLTLIASFDRPLDPDAIPGPESFKVVKADSTPLRVTKVLTHAQAEAERAARDSARAARDSARAAADTTVRRDSAKQNAVPPLPPPTTARRDTGRLAAGGRVTLPPPKPSRPAPPRDLTVRLDSLTPMQPGSNYRVVAMNVKGLLGQRRTSERVISVPRIRPDSTRARPDSARGRPDSARAPAPARRPP